MNIVLDLSHFELESIFFLETKPNIIMEGTFTKIHFSNEFCTLNGLFFYLPIQYQSVECFGNKYVLRFYPSNSLNISIVQQLSKIEYSMIEYYKELTNCTKKTSCILTKQLYSGNLKIFKESSGKSRNSVGTGGKYIIKVAGIWETHDSVGITYKVMECM
jgi:hypothetical protein